MFYSVNSSVGSVYGVSCYVSCCSVVVWCGGMVSVGDLDDGMGNVVLFIGVVWVRRGVCWLCCNVVSSV